MTNKRIYPSAFISCSLRKEDRSFVGYIEELASRNGFIPFGTVGRHAAAPMPLCEQMRNNVGKADCIILAATPRYIQQDIHNRQNTGRGISEMLHTEVGMAVMAGRPVLAFVQKDTNPGGFLGGLVQYIEIDPTDLNDVRTKWSLITDYFRNARAIIRRKWEKEKKDGWKDLGLKTLAVVGGAALLGSLADDSDEEYEDDSA